MAQHRTAQRAAHSPPHGMCSSRHSTAASSTAEAAVVMASRRSQGRSRSLRRASMACAKERWRHRGQVVCVAKHASWLPHLSSTVQRRTSASAGVPTSPKVQAAGL